MSSNNSSNPEHVVLADCRDNKNTLSSQMAYFPGAPSSTPQDVSIVNTPAGQTALWVSATTSGLFTTTGVTFVAKLGASGANGSFAGTGNNGYGDFTCWQRYALNLYKYGNTTCSQVYDCDHEAAPVTSSTSTPAASASSTSSASSGASAVSSKSTHLSSGALAGIIVGVVAGVLVVLAGIWLIFARRRKGKKQPAELQSDWQEGQTSKMKGMSAAHELDGQWGTVEVQGRSRAEIDGSSRAELDATEKQ